MILKGESPLSRIIRIITAPLALVIGICCFSMLIWKKVELDESGIKGVLLIKYFLMSICFAVIVNIVVNKIKKDRHIFRPFVDYGIAVASIGLATIWFFNKKIGFYADWYTHSWMVAYFSEYFKSHLSFPAVFSITTNVLSPSPVFYGFIFYPVCALINAITGDVNITIRILVWGIFSLQYFFCWKLFFLLSKRRIIATTVSMMCTWSIYPLTNLFQRSALTEFTAVSFGTIAFFIFMILVLFNNKAKTVFFRIRYSLYFLMCLAMCLGSHPITCLFFSIFLILAFLCFPSNVVSFVKDKINLIITLSLVLAVLMIMAPWLYAYLTIGKSLLITDYSINLEKVQLIRGVDNIINRFSLLLPSRDMRIESDVLQDVSTPYLDTQIMMPLLAFIFLLFIWGREGGIYLKNPNEKSKYRLALIVSVFSFLFFSVLSLNSRIYNFVPLFRITQFAYRMVSYQNFSVSLMAVAFFYFNRTHIKHKIPFYVLVASLIAVSFSSLMIKNEHIASIINLPMTSFKCLPATSFQPSRYDRKQLINERQVSYSNSYVDMSIKQCPSGQVGMVFFSINWDPMGKVEPLTVDIQSPGIYGTNVARSKWNSILLDDHVISSDKIWGDNGYLVVELPGGNHKLEALFTPPIAYIVLRSVSIVILCGLLLLLVVDTALLVRGRISQSKSVRKK
jgi:hypothetical protein